MLCLILPSSFVIEISSAQIACEVLILNLHVNYRRFAKNDN